MTSHHPEDAAQGYCGNCHDWTAAPATPMFYVLVCRDCGHGNLPMPFESAEARGKWAAAHTRATGHDRWFVHDQPGASRLAPGGTPRR
jgi:hypothetical protein